MNKVWLLSVEKAEYLMLSLQFLLGPVGSNNQARMQEYERGTQDFVNARSFCPPPHATSSQTSKTITPLPIANSQE